VEWGKRKGGGESTLMVSCGKGLPEGSGGVGENKDLELGEDSIRR